MGVTGFDNTFGYGRLDACRSVGEAFQKSNITGVNTFCSGSETYSISNAINGNLVTWSASPSGIVSLSPNGNQVTVTKITDGTITLTASITSGCGNFDAKKSVRIGAPERPKWLDLSGDEVNSLTVCTLVHKSICMTTTSPVDDWKWEINTGNANLQGLGHCGNIIGFTPSFGFIAVSTHNTCGWGSPTFITYQIKDCQHLAKTDNLFKLYSNPTYGIINVVPTNVKKQQLRKGVSEDDGFIKVIKIFASSGKIVKQQRFGNSSFGVHMDVSSLTPGIYFVEIGSGYRHTETHKLVIIGRDNGIRK